MVVNPLGKNLGWCNYALVTTGATALAAQTALTKAGHHVRGLICLARTPNPRPRR